MRVDLIEPTSPRWRDLVEGGPHDFYHLPSYATLAARTTDPGEAAAVLVEDDRGSLLLPVVLREIPGGGGWRDATTPYGYPGPLVRRGDAAFEAAALGATLEAFSARRLVSLFVRLHPVLNPASVERRLGTVVTHGETVAIDLSLDPARQWAQYQSGHRSEINRAVRAGHQAAEDPSWEHLPDFLRLYRETMGRVAASRYYLFEDDYFFQLRAALGDRLHLWCVRIGESIAAAALIVECEGIVQYHLSGSDEAFARERPTKLLLDAVRRWAFERGNRWFHLGGGLGGAADSLFRFKAGFSKVRLPFQTWRLIADVGRYRALAEERGHRPSTDADGFFPLYRRPTT